MDAGRVSGERKAALALSSLGEADRAWMLERLPEPRRARMTALLGELREMRVSFDGELVKQLGKEPEKKKELHGLDGADARALAEVLEREPDWLAAVVLRARAWPWRAALLEHLGPERERRITRLSPSDVKPKALAAVLAAFEQKVRELPDERPEMPKPFWRRRLSWRR